MRAPGAALLAAVPGRLAASGALLGALLLGGACSREAELRAKRCNDALEDGRRFVSGPDLEKTRATHRTAQESCPPEKQGEVDQLGRSIEVRAAQMELEKKVGERLARAPARPADEPLLPAADASVQTSNSCQLYVDCVCGLADAIQKGTGKDTYRSRCDEAKKAVAGKQRQDPACRELLGELTRDDGWKNVWETKGVTIPAICP